MKSCRFLLMAAAVAAMSMLMPSGKASAQNTWNQEQACPGWNNPTSFVTTYMPNFYYYKGRLGEKMYGSNDTLIPNASLARTGVNWSSTIINATSLATTTIQTGGDCALFPNGPGGASMTNRAFTILDSNTTCSGHPANTDPNTGHALKYVPTQFNTYDPGVVNTNLSKCIRIGDACGRPSSSGGYQNAEALYYYTRVTEDNALMYIYYSCVFEAPGHGLRGDPAIMIRVMKETSPGSGQWVQASPTRKNLTTHCDTLAYFITSTPQSNGGTVVDGQNGWHIYNNSYGSGYGTQTVYYKDWAKVALNLTGLLYRNVRIEVMVHDCNQMQHYAYAYICGECRPMKIDASGCPPGESTDVATLTAPRGLNNYIWSASEYGQSANVTDLDGGGDNHYFTFRQLTDDIGTEADSAYIYKVQADDFRVLYRPNAGQVQNIPASADSVGNWQTFRCTMTSALDPQKPFDSYLYVNVQNTKPSMFIDTLSICGGDVKLWNLSNVPGMPDLVDGANTQWMFLHNPNQEEPDSVLTGDSLTVHFDDNATHWVRVRTNIDETRITTGEQPEHGACYSEAVYSIQPIQNPAGGITISERVLCDDAPATLRDTTHNSVYRVWRFRQADPESGMELTDTVVGTGEQNREYTRSFSHGLEPVELLVRNGLFYLNPTNTSDTIWCESLLRDSISVFVHPELQVVGDTIVCQGMTTDATVTALGVEGCTYQWSLSPNSITGNLPSGNHLAVIPYADKSTYYVMVTSPQGCVAWDSIHAYLVSPKLTMLPADGRVCEGHEVHLTGSNASSYTWTASPTDSSLAGQDTLASIVVRPHVNTTYTLVGHGGSGDNICDATPLTAQVTVFPYPVPTVDVDPGIVDSEQPTVTLRDVSPYSVSSSWMFNDGTTSQGSEVSHTFEEATGVDSVHVTLFTTNELGCQVVYPFAIPVYLYTAWFPNAFTPNSEDENAYFRMYSINTYEHFSIHIYDRRGAEVFTSTDPAFQWDGTHDGVPCPQGGYVYVCRYRKPGTFNLSSMYGSITLVR